MCCGTNMPAVKLTKEITYRPEYLWRDTCRGIGQQRFVQWCFYRNGRIAWITPYAAPTASLPIGTGSTYSNMNATPLDISTYLVTNGIPVVAGDIIDIRVRIKNCQNELALSNYIRIIGVNVNVTECFCDLIRAYATGQTGLTPTPPGGYTAVGGELVFVNGVLTDGALDEPLVSTDEIMWVTLSGACTDTLRIDNVTAQTGNVTVPAGFITAVPNNLEWLVFRNGILQNTYSVSGSTLTPNDASDPSEAWTFVGLTGGDCALSQVSVSASASGATVALPSGYSATNVAKFIPVRNGLAMYDAANSTSGYSVSGSTITAETDFNNELVTIIAII